MGYSEQPQPRQATSQPPGGVYACSVADCDHPAEWVPVFMLYGNYRYDFAGVHPCPAVISKPFCTRCHVYFTEAEQLLTDGFWRLICDAAIWQGLGKVEPLRERTALTWQPLNNVTGAA